MSPVRSRVRLSPLQPEPWREEALCQDKPELFFNPEKREATRTRLLRENAAKAVCAECPVITQCREHALSTREPYGVWGGLSESDRDRLLSRGSAR